MPTQCSRDLFGYEVVEGRQVVASFDGGDNTSDAGALLLGATDRAIGLVARFAACFVDQRAQVQVEHSIAAMVAQRVFGIALGYEDLVEVRQQRSAIEADRPLQGLRRAVRDQALEPQDVDLEAIRADGDMAGGDGKALPCLVRQAGAQPRQGLAQVRARLGFRVIAPQQRGKFAAPMALRCRHEQVGEQGPDLAGRKAQRRPVGRAALEPAEQQQLHRVPSPRRLRHPIAPATSRQWAPGRLCPAAVTRSGTPRRHTDKISTKE